MVPGEHKREGHYNFVNPKVKMTRACQWVFTFKDYISKKQIN